jgi:2'-5' RNA ligase
VTAADVSRHMRDHWWWRPGWRIGRSMYTFHVTFAAQPRLHDLVAVYQDALASLPGLDPIPMQWLHLTMQGIGFSDEVPTQDIAAIAEAAQQHLAAQPPVPLVIGPALVDPEAIMLTVHPDAALDPVRAAVRAAIADVWGSSRVPEGEDWTPHISMAYSHTTDAAAPYIDAISTVSPAPAELTIPAIQLIELNRDTHLYQWVTRADVPLGG